MINPLNTMSCSWNVCNFLVNWIIKYCVLLLFWAYTFFAYEQCWCSKGWRNNQVTSSVPSIQSTDCNLFSFSHSLKLSFVRLCRISHITMLLSLVYFCNICLWFVMTKKASLRTFRYRFRVMLWYHNCHLLMSAITWTDNWADIS